MDDSFSHIDGVTFRPLGSSLHGLSLSSSSSSSPYHRSSREEKEEDGLIDSSASLPFLSGPIKLEAYRSPAERARLDASHSRPYTQSYANSHMREEEEMDVRLLAPSLSSTLSLSPAPTRPPPSLPPSLLNLTAQHQAHIQAQQQDGYSNEVYEVQAAGSLESSTSSHRHASPALASSKRPPSTTPSPAIVPIASSSKRSPSPAIAAASTKRAASPVVAAGTQTPLPASLSASLMHASTSPSSPPSSSPSSSSADANQSVNLPFLLQDQRRLRLRLRAAQQAIEALAAEQTHQAPTLGMMGTSISNPNKPTSTSKDKSSSSITLASYAHLSAPRAVLRILARLQDEESLFLHEREAWVVQRNQLSSSLSSAQHTIMTLQASKESLEAARTYWSQQEQWHNEQMKDSRVQMKEMGERYSRELSDVQEQLLRERVIGAQNVERHREELMEWKNRYEMAMKSLRDRESAPSTTSTIPPHHALPAYIDALHAEQQRTIAALEEELGRAESRYRSNLKQMEGQIYVERQKVDKNDRELKHARDAQQLAQNQLLAALAQMSEWNKREQTQNYNGRETSPSLLDSLYESGSIGRVSREEEEERREQQWQEEWQWERIKENQREEERVKREKQKREREDRERRDREERIQERERERARERSASASRVRSASRTRSPPKHNITTTTLSDSLEQTHYPALTLGSLLPLPFNLPPNTRVTGSISLHLADPVHGDNSRSVIVEKEDEDDKLLHVHFAPQDSLASSSSTPALPIPISSYPPPSSSSSHPHPHHDAQIQTSIVYAQPSSSVYTQWPSNAHVQTQTSLASSPLPSPRARSISHSRSRSPGNQNRRRNTKSPCNRPECPGNPEVAARRERSMRAPSDDHTPASGVTIRLVRGGGGSLAPSRLQPGMSRGRSRKTAKEVYQQMEQQEYLYDRYGKIYPNRQAWP